MSDAPVTARWVSFARREFWDVPRCVVFVEDDHCYFLDGRFDDALDEYPPDYQVYELPVSLFSALPMNWGELPGRALRRLGTIPVASVRFDETRRAQVDASVLDRLTGRTGPG